MHQPIITLANPRPGDEDALLRRPEASALLAELKNPNREFDAVVIGESHRAFYGNQYGPTFPLFEHYGVPLWVPEVGGLIDPASEAHDLVMSVFGGMSKGERNNVKILVRTAMAAQAQVEGHFLGGRPTCSWMWGRGPDTSSTGIIKGLERDTLIIVRNSRGVQVGDRNTQRNKFLIRIRAVNVNADGIGVTRERLEWISRLRENPDDRAVAQRLAEDLGRAARRELQADLTVRVRLITRVSEIHRWAGRFLRLVGRQIGGPGNRARARVDVTVQKLDTRALERDFRAVAWLRLPRPQNRVHQ